MKIGLILLQKRKYQSNQHEDEDIRMMRLKASHKGVQKEKIPEARWSIAVIVGLSDP